MKERNNLYPIFLKAANLNILVVGGGFVALEKLTFLLKSSPDANVTMVAPFYRPETLEFLKDKKTVTRIVDRYNVSYLSRKHMVVASTDDVPVNEGIYHDCRARKLLVNVADNPPFCDFYMGGIVSKGHVKIAISTNGQSPTTAKRLRQFFEEVIPDDINQLVMNLNEFRKTIKGDFEEKVKSLNKITETLIK